MEAIAAFAATPEGRLYAMSCERYGVDPAADVTDDPIEAANLRAALALTTLPEPAETDEPSAYEKVKAAHAEAFGGG